MKNDPYDIAIVGGGLAGVSAAYFLAKEGLSVILFEADHVGSGATSKTTAMISQMIDTSPADLIKLVGLREARLVWESGGEAIRTIERIAQKESIECNFMRVPAFVYANTKREYDDLEDESIAMEKLGSHPKLHASSYVAFKNAGCLELPRQAKFDAGKYVQGLADAARKYGAKILERTRVHGISRNVPSSTGFSVTTGRRSFTANRVLIATYQPYGNPKQTHFKKGMYTSYCFEVKVPAGKFKEAIYWDLQNPYHYFRIDRGSGKNDTMIIGGEDHRAEIKIDSRKNFRALEEYLRGLLGPTEYTIVSRWTGPILEPSDGLPLIGEYEPDAFVAAAFSGNGMTYSTITGLIVHDIMSGRKNAWIPVYNPSRPMKAGRIAKKAYDYAGEFIGGALKNVLK